jgi:hypothetical protein
VSQPLWPFLDEKAPVEAALAGTTSIASVRQNDVDVAEILCGLPSLDR